MTVHTSDVFYAGTDLKVDIFLAGTAGDSGEVELESTDKVPDPFERGRLDYSIVLLLSSKLKKNLNSYFISQTNNLKLVNI